jgi:hypothetical protein
MARSFFYQNNLLAIHLFVPNAGRPANRSKHDMEFKRHLETLVPDLRDARVN